MSPQNDESVIGLVFAADEIVHKALAARQPPEFSEIKRSDPVVMSQVAEGLARVILEIPPSATMSLTDDQQDQWDTRSEMWTNFPPDTRLRVALLAAARLVPAGGLAAIWAALLEESELEIK
jgi:hypothetical protein